MSRPSFHSKSRSVSSPGIPSTSKPRHQRGSHSYSRSVSHSHSRSHTHSGPLHVALSTLRASPPLYSHDERPEELELMLSSSSSAPSLSTLVHTHDVSRSERGFGQVDEEKGFRRASLSETYGAGRHNFATGGRVVGTSGDEKRNFGISAEDGASASDPTRHYAYAFHSSARRTTDGSAYYACQEEWASRRRRKLMLGSWVAMLMLLMLGSWAICHETLQRF